MAPSSPENLLPVRKSAPLVRLTRRIRDRPDTFTALDSQELVARSSSFGDTRSGVLSMPALRSHKRRASGSGIKSMKVRGAGMTEAVEKMCIATWSLKTKENAEGSWRVWRVRLRLGRNCNIAAALHCSVFSAPWICWLLFQSFFSPTPSFAAALLIIRPPRTHVHLSQPVEIATFPYEPIASTGWKTLLSVLRGRRIYPACADPVVSPMLCSMFPFCMLSGPM